LCCGGSGGVEKDVGEAAGAVGQEGLMELVGAGNKEDYGDGQGVSDGMSGCEVGDEAVQVGGGAAQGEAESAIAEQG
jgi:hypothetical protein